ncbi:hypothetical protein CPB83DRAFT_888588 [Crepidotus variabilis]|uniref:XRRM domain-containing protein n=1 Tax=Crepidotus variabilis TaxID=179855 RepID=A0A9P6ETX9_9AGAR|nr:hypothetical protein CPB83DRAFT_888588 [Crepidotus variabilis]
MSTLVFIPRAVKKRKGDSSLEPVKPESSNIANSMTRLSTLARRAEGIVEHHGRISGNERRQWPLFRREKSIRDTEGPGYPELAILIWLALSDYALWNDGDLRRHIDCGTKLDEEGDAGDIKDDELAMTVEGGSKPKAGDQAISDIGYVPLSWIFDHSTILRLVSRFPKLNLDGQSEAVFVNSLHTYALGILDGRFIVDPEASSSTRSSVNRLQKGKLLVSGYEIRRTIYASWKDSDLASFTKAKWDELTLYVENIPSEYRKLPEIAKLLILLLPPLMSAQNEVTRVQHVHLPSHHQDEPEDIPYCKGFALVTFSFQEDVEYFLRRWPWEKVQAPAKAPEALNRNRRSRSSSQEESESDAEKKEEREPRRGRSGRPEAELARSRGLRVCTKTRWEELRQEYLAYGQRLVEELAQEQDAKTNVESKDGAQVVPAAESLNDMLYDTKAALFVKEEGKSVKTKPTETTRGKKRNHEEIETQDISGRGYPLGCMVLVRNLHFATNKTALRSIFKRPWKDDTTTVTYVDYAKCMEVCYVRCLVPADAQQFVHYFSSHCIVQTDGLDGEGTEIQDGISVPDGDQKPIVVEIISGAREKIYWEKQAENVRKKALEQTMRALGQATHGISGNTDDNGVYRKHKKSRRE